jgi:hypothetical protein
VKPGIAWPIAQAAVTAVLLVVLFSGFDWTAFTRLYTRIPFWLYLVSFAVVFAGQVLYAWRWRLLLVASGVRIRFREILAQYLIGVFVNNFLPSTVGGDAAKVYLLGREHGYRTITASVVLDRSLGIGLLAALAACALHLESSPDPVLRLARAAVTTLAVGTFAVLALIGFGTGGLASHVRRFGGRAMMMADELKRFRLAMSAAVRHPAVLLQAAGTVLLNFVVLTILYQSLIAHLAGLHLGFLPVIMVVSSATVLSNIPISFNGLGLREQLHFLLLQPYGVPKEVAIAISFLLFAHMLLLSAVGGLLWARLGIAARNTADLDAVTHV